MEKFSYEANGYNRREVSQFINSVYEQTKGLIEEAERQRDEIEKLKMQLKQYELMEDNLKQAVLNAQTAGDNIRKMSREEASSIIQDAKSNANRIVNDALVRAEKIEMEREMLERNMKIFKRKIRLAVEQQAAVIDEIDDIVLE